MDLREIQNIINSVFYDVYCKKITLYIGRYQKNGKYINSAPCRECLDMLQKFNIKKIVFVNEHNNIIECKPRNFSTNHYSSCSRFKNKK